MPDISMCAHETCPLRQSCYRHAESGTRPSFQPYQWYNEFQPFETSTGKWLCSGYEPKNGVYITSIKP